VKRLFLDANVLFTAAHNPAGKASLIFEPAVMGHWAIVTSGQAVEEARHNLRLKYPACLPRLEMLLKNALVAPVVDGRACPLDLPAKDVPIFLAAVHARATHLLTGDLRHFGRFMDPPSQTGGITICTVSTFLEQVLA
jgi:uncharacterized protein